MRKNSPFIVRATLLAVAVSALAILSAGVGLAQVVTVSTTPQVGSSNPVTAAPLVPRPNTQPCVVQLFNNLAFDNFTPASFSYAPPSSCPGPWAKVVFTADFTVTAGRPVSIAPPPSILGTPTSITEPPLSRAPR